MALSRYALTDTSKMTAESRRRRFEQKRRPKYSGSVVTSLRRMYRPKNPAP